MSVSPVSLLLVILALVIALQVATVSLVLWRWRGAGRRAPVADLPALTVLRPVRGLDAGLEEALTSSFSAQAIDYEVLFCVADADDPAVPLCRAIVAKYGEGRARLLIGDDRISANPKLNNMAKGWAAARHDWVVMIDSNVLLPTDYVQTLFGTWTKGTGLVTSPPAGVRALGFWASVEAGFLNGYQARWQLAADQIGLGFAQGKVLMWRRELLDRAGGIAMLGSDLAEDVASTKLVRAAGLKVRVLPRPFPQPLYKRSAREVWSRQKRWACLRRDGFPALFALEPLSFALLPALAGGALVGAGTVPATVALASAVLWYGLEWLLVRRAGWPASIAQIPAWLLRDLMMPVIWLTSLGTRDFVWRGNEMSADPEHPPVKDSVRS